MLLALPLAVMTAVPIGRATFLIKDQKGINQQWYKIDRGEGYYNYQKVDTEHCLDGGGEQSLNGKDQQT